jgi:hypothetical protein
VSGEWPGIEELRDLRQQLVSRGDLTPETKVLFDIRMVATTPMVSDVAEMVAAAVQQGGLPFQRAYLVAAAVQYGVVRQMQALAPPPISIEIFTSEAEATTWLHR